MKVGYARVSSFGQSLDLQRHKLLEAGCHQIFEEKMSASTLQKREALDLTLNMLRDSDLLVVTKLDRLARSMQDLFQIATQLKEKNVHLHVLDQSINTQTSEGRLLFNVLGSFAEFENDIRRERQFDGIARAKKEGVRFGRRPLLLPKQREEIIRLRIEENFTLRQLMDKFGCSKRTVYRVLDEETRPSKQSK